MALEIVCVYDFSQHEFVFFHSMKALNETAENLMIFSFRCWKMSMVKKLLRENEKQVEDIRLEDTNESGNRSK